MSLVFSLKIFAMLAAPGTPAAARVAPTHTPWLLVAGGLVFLCGLICDVYLFRRFIGRAELKVPFQPWTLHELSIAAGIFFAVLMVSNLCYAGIGALTHQPLDKLASLIIPTECLTRIGVLLGFGYFFHRRRINLAQSFGLNTLAPSQAIRWGVVFGFASVLPVQLLIVTTEKLCHLLHIKLSEQPITGLFLTTNSTPLLTMLMLFAIVVAPVFEEFLFRGFAYPALKQRFGAWPALLVISAIFAVSHFHGPSMPALLLLAIGLGLAYELTGSLLTSITMHAVFNGIMVVKLLFDRAHT